MDSSPPGSSVHRILRERTLEWVVLHFSRGSSRPRYRTRVSCRAGRFFTVWVIREACICSWMYLKIHLLFKTFCMTKSLALRFFCFLNIQIRKASLLDRAFSLFQARPRWIWCSCNAPSLLVNAIDVATCLSARAKGDLFYFAKFPSQKVFTSRNNPEDMEMLLILIRI